MKAFELLSLREGASAECPSDFKLDRHVGGVRDAAVDAHGVGCATCKARLDLRERGWAAQPVDPRPVLAAIRRAEPSRAPWWRRLLPVVAVAAVAAILILVTRPDGDTTRIKGGAIFKVFRFEQGHSKEVQSGAQFAPGDRLRFVVDLPAPGAVSVIGVDAKRSLYVAWPSGNESAFRPAGSGIELPGAVALDQTPGNETLFLVHCPGREAAPACASSSAGPPECGAGCSLVAFEVKKK